AARHRVVPEGDVGAQLHRPRHLGVRRQEDARSERRQPPAIGDDRHGRYRAGSTERITRWVSGRWRSNSLRGPEVRKSTLPAPFGILSTRVLCAIMPLPLSMRTRTPRTPPRVRTSRSGADQVLSAAPFCRMFAITACGSASDVGLART